MATNVKNATFSLPVTLLERMKNYAKNQDIPSLNAGVKEALEEYSKKIEKRKASQTDEKGIAGPPVYERSRR